MKFIDPKTDYAFKRIFGSEDSADTLISFINASLLLEGDRRIKTVSIQNPYQTPDLPVLKESIVDIACIDHRGVRYLVEMQVGKVKGFANRLIYNLTKCYSGQLNRGEDYPSMNDVVVIAIMDFILFENFGPYHSIYLLQDHKTHYAPFNQLKVCCLELQKFQKGEENLGDMLDKWIYFLKEAPNLEIRPDILRDKDFDKAFERAKASNLTREEKELYDVAVMKALDQKGLIEQALDEGRAEGEKQKANKTALAMLKDGLSLEVIQKYIGLSKKEIGSLKK